MCTACALLHGAVGTFGVVLLVTLYTGQLEVSAAPVERYTSLTRLTEATFCLAYIVDLFAVICVHVVPYSRCDPVPSKGGRDILVHHIPSLIGGSLLGAPWFFSFPVADPRLGLLRGAGAVEVAAIVLRWRGWTMLSSFNEMLMCMQRVDVPAGLWNSRAVYTLELLWKVLIFTAFAACGVGASTEMLWRIGASCADEHAPGLLSAGAARCVAASPFAWSVGVYLLFIATMYPSMAKRAIKKLRDVASGRKYGTPPGAPEGYPRDELLERPPTKPALPHPISETSVMAALTQSFAAEEPAAACKPKKA